MTLNDVMIRHNFITKIVLKDGEKELSKELKVKIMSIRIELGKVRKQFEDDLQEFLKQATPEELQTLTQKEDKTEEDKQKIAELNQKLTDEYNSYVDSKGKEEKEVEAKFTQEEYNEILEVNAGNDVNINGAKLSAPDFLEVIYSLFVV